MKFRTGILIFFKMRLDLIHSHLLIDLNSKIGVFRKEIISIKD